MACKGNFGPSHDREVQRFKAKGRENIQDTLLGFCPKPSRTSSEPVPIPQLQCSRSCCQGSDNLFSRARAVNLAQASRARLSESDEGSPKPFYAKRRPGDPLNFFERANISPKREGSRLSEIPRETFRVALQWSGRNSMIPVSGCPWWCPICITRGEQRYPPQVQASAEFDHGYMYLDEPSRVVVYCLNSYNMLG
ncbi:hypothetical protein DEO72_LG11g2112 [Vigna unguiculata]|uniref:Uncharacterized protein n=1 Tax=Vigna unguiculata TaxID=3917 RepID=A0A4D6NR11_VIGUN|nr:hypothetical protein DEO72_LG11g2112 [Vigna unguiculata]